MSSMIFAISYFYVKNTYEDFDIQMKRFVDEYYTQKKKTLKKEVNTIIDILNYNVAKENISDSKAKEDAIRLLNNITFQKNKSNYFFVYEIKDINGGDNFAKMIVNPNRPDLQNRLISTNYKDTKGQKFRKKFMEGIRKNGEAYVEYTYKKPDLKEVRQKLSYFKLYENWNWVIALGIYTDDIDKEILLKKEALKKRIKEQVTQNIVLFLMFLSIAILISIVISKKIDELLFRYKQNVKLKAKELKVLNQTLEQRVKEEIEKNREKEQLLVEKSRFIALGEMISNIAHQWRQPLSELSSILMFIKFKHSIKALDKKTIDEKSNEADNVIEYMSQTIDGFRNFFMPKKAKEEFYLYKVVDLVMSIVSSTLENYNIEVKMNIDKDIKLNTYKNEYQQVILNIINNAKDILVEKSIEKPTIRIEAFEDGQNTVLFIQDNGLGIKVEPKGKIFEPYFTTKQDSNGTGIGLYMSKIIVEKNMKGKLKVKNAPKGAKFSIIIPKN